MESTPFYTKLPVLTEFADVGRPECYSPLPDSWHVVMCDVRDSTAAVEAGRYKNVNTVGAAMITAALNAAGKVDIPFIFEGDGAMLCVPPQLLDAARAALLQTQAMARESFGLELRVATLAMAQIRAAGFNRFGQDLTPRKPSRRPPFLMQVLPRASANARGSAGSTLERR